MTGFLGRLHRGETDFDFMSRYRLYFTIAAVLVGVSLLSIVIRGFNFSIEFTGGTALEAENATGLDLSAYRDALAEVGQDGARLQFVGDEGSSITVATEPLDDEELDALIDVFAVAAGVDPDQVSVDAVGPTFGEEITRRAIQALVVFLLVVSVFITLRYEWKMAVVTLAAVFHDLIVTAGIYSLLGFEVTPATVIAVLTILGYSLYDGVVVFDKIDENVHALGNKLTFTEITNVSMNEVLMRSMVTVLTSLIPIGSLLFIGSFVLGARPLEDFALALFIGVAAGTFSSLFLSTPLLAVWREREPEWQRMQRRAERRGDVPVTAVAQVAEEVAEAPVAAGAATVAPRSGDVVARPPRQRRKKR